MMRIIIICAIAVHCSSIPSFTAETHDAGIGKAYLITGTCFSLPVMASLPFLTPDQASAPTRAVGIALFTTGASWGTSLGYYYSGYSTYAVVSGALRTLLLGTSLADSYFISRRETGFNRFLLFTALTWDLVDMLALGPVMDYHKNDREYLRPERIRYASFSTHL